MKQTKIMQLIRERELRKREFEALPEHDMNESTESFSFEDGVELNLAPWAPSALHSFYMQDAEPIE